MALRLDRISKTVEKYMLDTVTIRRPKEGTIDPVSMEILADSEKVYNGPAMVSPVGDPGMTQDSGLRVYRTQYEVGIPLAAGEIKSGDLVTVDTTRNVEFLGETLTVHDEIRGTFATHQRLKAYLDRPQP